MDHIKNFESEDWDSFVGDLFDIHTDLSVKVIGDTINFTTYDYPIKLLIKELSLKGIKAEDLGNIEPEELPNKSKLWVDFTKELDTRKLRLSGSYEISNIIKMFPFENTSYRYKIKYSFELRDISNVKDKDNRLYRLFYNKMQGFVRKHI